ncbi:MAG: ATP-binding protein [Pseudomonadota bacterium]
MIKNSALRLLATALVLLWLQPVMAATSWRQLDQLTAEQLLVTQRPFTGVDAARANLLLAHKLAPTRGKAALSHLETAREAFAWRRGSDEAVFAEAVQCYNWLVWGDMGRALKHCAVAEDPAKISAFVASHLMRARAIAAFRDGRPVEAMEDIALAIGHARRSGSAAQLGNALMNRGLMLYERGLIDEALVAYDEASELTSIVAPDDPLATLLFFNLGLVHIAAGQYQQATVNLQAGLDWAIETEQHQRQLIAQTYLGLARLGLDQPDKAIEGLSPLLDNPPETFSPDTVSNGLLVRAKARLASGQLDETRQDLERGLALIEATDRNNLRHCQLELVQADLEILEGQDLIAQQLLYRVLEHTSGAGVSEHLEALEKLQAIYERAGDFPRALELSRRLFERRQEQIGENYESRLSMLQVATDVANRENELSLLEQRGIAASAAARTDRYVRNGVLFGSLLVCALIFVLVSHRSSRLVSDARLKANQELEQQVFERTAELSAQAEQTAKLQSQRAKLARELALAEKERAVGQLTQGITHDFNNVLMVLARSAEELRRGATAQQRALLDEIEAAIDSGSGLTRSLLSYARMQPLNPQYLRLDFFIEEVESLLQRTLGPSITMSSRLCPAAAVVDASALSTALLNLVINARDAMNEQGEVAIAVFPVAGASPPLVNIQVTDSGRGMSKEVLNRGTEPYFTTRGDSGGTGLGLSMVAGFAQQSGGKLLLGNAPTAGARITLQLPAAPIREQNVIGHNPASQAVPERRSDAAMIPGSAEDPKLDGEANWSMSEDASALLVEDHPGVAAVLTTGLEQLGYDVTHVASAEAALENLQSSGSTALLVADIGLSGSMDGLTLVRQVRRDHPHLAVMVTTGRTQSCTDEFVVLTKPFRMAELKTAVEEATHGAELKRLAGPADRGSAS